MANIVSVVCVVLISSASVDFAAAGDLGAIKARGTLKVVAAAAEQPEIFAFGSGPDGGFERELIDSFARRHGAVVEVVRAPSFGDRIPLLEQGAGDVAIGMVVTEARKRLVDFTAEVLPARHVVVSREAAGFATVEALRAAKVGVLKGSSWADAVRVEGVPQEATAEFDSLEKLMEALRTGRIEATVMTVVDASLAAKRDPQLHLGTTVGPEGVAAWGVPKGARELKAALDQHLDMARRGGAWSRLVVKYFGPQALTVLARRPITRD